jgi:peptide/nickel transport system substrate-binding protein
MGGHPTRWTTLALAAASALMAAACSGAPGALRPSVPSSTAPGEDLAATTPAGTAPVSSVVWRAYRNVDSLDPVFSVDFPEYTAVSLMCESLLRQAPDGAVGPGLATVANPSPTTMVFTLRPGTRFWDGHPVTSADVVYSLDRNINPAIGGYYGPVFDRVASITATGPEQVTIELKQPDYWLEEELASMPGVVIEKSFAQKEGRNYGTPAGGIMCTGAYMLKSWAAGGNVTAVANPHYWNPSVHPLVGQIIIEGVPGVPAVTAGLLTGAIQGTYIFSLPTLGQLEASGKVTVVRGLGWSTDAFDVTSLKGVLGDVRVRQALSLALDRQGIINSVYAGAALAPRWLSSPGTFGYGKSVFEAAYNSSPAMTQNLAEAKKLVQEAGATGKTLTIGTTSQLTGIATETGAYQAAAQAIGLKVVLRSLPAQDYADFITDPKARAGIDGFLTVDNGDDADPAGLLAEVDLPGGLLNVDGFNDPQITALLDQARTTANPDRRAALVAMAEKLTAQQLPWIPDAQPDTLLVLGKGLTGAVASFAAMFSPWANALGGTG